MPTRNNDGILQPLEQPILRWFAQRMPLGVTPDMLTWIGFLGACLAAISYGAAGWQPAFLWLASIGLVINWFGDSLDGSLARFRNIERPRYGFFLDQNLDAVAQLLFAVGFGVSGFIRFEIAMFALATYFLLSILSLVRAITQNVFSMTYGTVGLTELRLLFIAVNALMFFFPPQPIFIAGLSFKYPELISVAWAASMLIAFFFSYKSDLKQLAAQEP